MEYMKDVARKIKNAALRFAHEEDGVGVVEIVLILVILVGLVLIFKDQIGDVVSNALESFSNDSSEIIG